MKLAIVVLVILPLVFSASVDKRFLLDNLLGGIDGKIAIFFVLFMCKYIYTE